MASFVCRRVSTAPPSDINAIKGDLQGPTQTIVWWCKVQAIRRKISHPNFPSFFRIAKDVCDLFSSLILVDFYRCLVIMTLFTVNVRATTLLSTVIQSFCRAAAAAAAVQFLSSPTKHTILPLFALMWVLLEEHILFALDFWVGFL